METWHFRYFFKVFSPFIVVFNSFVLLKPKNHQFTSFEMTQTQPWVLENGQNPPKSGPFNGSMCLRRFIARFMARYGWICLFAHKVATVSIWLLSDEVKTFPDTELGTREFRTESTFFLWLFLRNRNLLLRRSRLSRLECFRVSGRGRGDLGGAGIRMLGWFEKRTARLKNCENVKNGKKWWKW